jgi:hypothetical protein
VGFGRRTSARIICKRQDQKPVEEFAFWADPRWMKFPLRKNFWRCYYLFFLKSFKEFFFQLHAHCKVLSPKPHWTFMSVLVMFNLDWICNGGDLSKSRSAWWQGSCDVEPADDDRNEKNFEPRANPVHVLGHRILVSCGANVISFTGV